MSFLIQEALFPPTPAWLLLLKTALEQDWNKLLQDFNSQRGFLFLIHLFLLWFDRANQHAAFDDERFVADWTIFKKWQ